MAKQLNKNETLELKLRLRLPLKGFWRKLRRLALAPLVLLLFVRNVEAPTNNSRQHYEAKTTYLNNVNRPIKRKIGSRPTRTIRERKGKRH